jgi:hypothetical protein
VERVGGATIQGAASLYINSQLPRWLVPSVARVLLSYARDAYLYGYNNETRQLLTDLQQSIHVSPMFVDPNWPALEEQAELAQIDGEVNTLLLQLVAHRDFFGNPAGYVPLLSFEVLTSLYEADIEASLRTWWLTYWLNHRVHTLQEKQQALGTTKNHLTLEVWSLSVDLTNTQVRITALQARSAVLNTNLAFLGKRLEERQEELRRAAEAAAQAAAEEARRKKKRNLWRQIVYSVGSVMQVVPAWQPVLGAIGTGLQFVAQLQSPVAVQGIVEVNHVLNLVQSPLFGQGIGQVQFVAAQIASGVQAGNWSGLLQAVRDNVVPAAMASLNQAWKQADAKHADVQREVQRMKALAPELNIAVTLDGLTMGLLDHISAKTAELRSVGQEIASEFLRLGELTEGIKRDALALDAINRDLSSGTGVLDHRTLTYIREMERRTIDRLRLYHYLVARAYEYRLVSAYPGELDVERLVQRMLAIAEAGHQGEEFLSQEEFQSLGGVYDDILSEIVRKVVDYLGQNPRSTRQVTYRLSASDLDQLNGDLWLRVNLMEKGVLDPTREDVRITALDLTGIGVADLVHEPNSTMTVEVLHSGNNKLRHGTQDLLFHSTNYIYWAATYEANDGQFYKDHVSPLSASLLCFLLQHSGQTCDANLSLFSAPAAWADLYLTKASSWNIYPSDIMVTNLTLQCTTEFTSWNLRYGSVEVFPSSEDISPLFLFDEVDLRGRQHGIGRVYRTYQTNTTIQVSAPRAYGSWRFVKWSWGRTNSSVNPKLTLAVPRSGVSLQAIFVNSDADEDGLPDWFEKWKWEKLPNRPADSLAFEPMDDPDKDGHTLLEEYLGLEQPVIVDPLPAPNGGFRCVVYADPGSRHVVEATTEVQAPPELTVWTPIYEVQVSDDPASIVLDDDSPTSIEHTPGPGARRLFYRVRTLTE